MVREKIVYMADYEQLRPGDIVLTRVSLKHSKNIFGYLVSSGIRRYTKGKYSHALICTSPPVLTEAIKDNVTNISLQACYVNKLDNIQVLRFYDERIAIEAAKHAQFFMGRGYSMIAAIKSVFPRAVVKKIGNTTFCSALVATTYAKAGAAEFAKIDPLKVSPATLQKMGCFTDVTLNVFNEYKAPKHIKKYSALDGDRVKNPLRNQGRILNKYFKKIFPMCQYLERKDFKLRSDLPNSFYELIIFLVDHLKEPVQEPLLGLIKEIDSKAASLLGSGEVKLMLQKAIKYEVKQLSEQLQCPTVSDHEIEKMLRMTESQIKDRASAFALQSKLSPGVCKLFDADIALREYFQNEGYGKRIALLNGALSLARASV